MKKFNFYLLFAVVVSALLITGCKKEDDPEVNTITITIDEPIDGETITDCSEVHVHVDVVASDENHNIEIVLHPEGNVDDKILDVDLHEHDAVINFDQEVDLCGYDAGTCFHLEVEACIDHDCETKETAEVEFCLQ